jgi:hypothetical protein
MAARKTKPQPEAKAEAPANAVISSLAAETFEPREPKVEQMSETTTRVTY